jgi:hypothetical protein
LEILGGAEVWDGTEAILCDVVDAVRHTK